MITLIRAADIDAERGWSRRLPSLRAEFGRPFAPVLDRDGLPDRIAVVLRAQGGKVELLDEMQLDQVPPASACPRPANAADVRLNLVIASPGVAVDLLELAAGLCDGPILSLSALVGEIGPPLPAGAETALLLLNPDATPPPAIVAAVQRLEASRIPWGLIHVFDPVAARFAILKAMLVEHAEAGGRYGFMSSAYAPRAGDGAPEWLRPDGAAGGRTFFEARHGVLLLSGHANALDASIGKHLVLCARHGAPDRGVDVLPCFDDGICFRQPAMGPAHDLLDPRRIRAPVLVMSGCNLLPLAKSWFATRSSLVHQAVEGEVLAVIAASVASIVRMELDLLCLALIAEGLPLGQVVAALNRVRRDVLHHATGLPPGIGPFALLGNPKLRVEGIGIETISCEAIEDPVEGRRFLRIVPPPGAIDPGAGALLRCPIPPAAALPCLTLHDTADGAWCRGIRHDDGRQDMLYLWLGGKSAEPLLLEVSARDSWAPVRKAIDSFWAELPFWMQFLDCYRQDMQAHGHATALFDGLVADLPALARRLAASSAGMHRTAGVIASRTALTALAAAAWRELALWSETLLEATVDAMVSIGRVHSYGTPPFYRLADAIERSEPCLCPGGLMTGQAFLAPDGRSRRVEYQCGLCGASADEDGRGALRIVRIPETLRAGDRLICECRCVAPDDSQVHVHAMLVLEPWTPGPRVASGTHRDILEANASSRFRLEMTLPDTLAEGAYPVAVVALVNGSLCILRRMLGIGRRSG